MESSLCDVANADLKIIETLLWADGRLHRLDRHLVRAAETCAQLGFGFDPAKAEAALRHAATGQRMRMCLTIDRAGEVEATATRIAQNADETIWRLRLSEQRLNPDDPWLRMKTSNRRRYDAARAALPDDVDEAIFANDRDELCEGAITNIFLDLGESLLTPSLSSGLLPGVLRAEMLATATCKEEVIPLAALDQARAIWVGNSLRGLIRAEMA